MTNCSGEHWGEDGEKSYRGWKIQEGEVEKGEQLRADNFERN